MESGDEERVHPVARHLQLPVGLGLSGSDLGNGFVHRQPERYRQPGIPDDRLPQFMCPLQHPEETVHPCNIDVVLIDGGLLVHRCLFGNDIRDHVRIFGIKLHVAPDDHRIAAQHPRHLHRHGRMNAKLPRLIAAARHHPPVGRTPDDHRLTHQIRPYKPLYRHEEGVEVEVDDIAGGKNTW